MNRKMFVLNILSDIVDLRVFTDLFCDFVGYFVHGIFTVYRKKSIML